MPPPDGLLVACDADDTLWATRGLYDDLAASVQAMLADAFGADQGVLAARYEEMVGQNQLAVGYGALSFSRTLTSLVLAVAGDRPVPSKLLALIADGCDNIHEAPLQVFDSAAEGIAAMSAAGCRVVVVTKGSAYEQTRKLARSGISELVDGLCVLPDKSDASWRRFIDSCGAPAERVVSVGDDWIQDVAPLLRLGARAVWCTDPAEPDPFLAKIVRVSSLMELAEMIQQDRLPPMAAPGVSPPEKGMLPPPEPAVEAAALPAAPPESVSEPLDPLAGHPAVSPPYVASVPEPEPVTPEPVLEPAPDPVPPLANRVRDEMGTEALQVFAEASEGEVLKVRLANGSVTYASIYHPGTPGSDCCFGLECDSEGALLPQVA